MGTCTSQESPQQPPRGQHRGAQQQQQQQQQQYAGARGIYPPQMQGSGPPPHVTPAGQWMPPTYQNGGYVNWNTGVSSQGQRGMTLLQVPMMVSQQQQRQQLQGPPAPDVVEAKHVVNQANLLKSTIHLVRRSRRRSRQHRGSGGEGEEEPPSGPSPSKKYRLAFELDCSTPCTASVFVFCEERGVKRGKVSLKSLQPRLRLQPLATVEFQAGSGQKYLSEGHIDFSLYPQLPKKPNAWMLIVQLRSIDVSGQGEAAVSPRQPKLPPGRKAPPRSGSSGTVPGEDSGSVNSAEAEDESPTGSSGQRARRQYQYSYCEVDLQTGSISVAAQKLQIAGELYEVEDIYGGSTEDEVHNRDAAVAAGNLLALEDTSECSICLCEPCDTLIMPCRHQCICAGCAELLRTQSNKCPICRTAITGLLKERATPPPSPPPDALRP